MQPIKLIKNADRKVPQTRSRIRSAAKRKTSPQGVRSWVVEFKKNRSDESLTAFDNLFKDGLPQVVSPIEPAQPGSMNNDETELADPFVQHVQDLFRQPTAEEVSRLTYGELRDLRNFIPEEARNHFAHLLNRGSPLE